MENANECPGHSLHLRVRLICKKQRIGLGNCCCTLFDLATGYGTEQNRQQGTRQKQELLSFTEPRDNFLSTVQLYKIRKYQFYFRI
jgi:hypothetical protein